MSSAVFRYRLPELAPAASGCFEVEIAAAEWLTSGADLLAFDRRVHEAEQAGPFDLVVAGEAADVERAGREVLARYQRLFPQVNDYSRSTFFDGVLAFHRGMHALDKPLVRADWEHAIDTWQWVLRLEPDAGLAVQLAALFHDVERLISEADARVEQDAPDYAAFKNEHARRGAHLVRRVMRRLDAWPLLIERVAGLVERHETPDGGGDLALLNDADALSFFSLNSAGFLAYFGEEHTAAKVEYTLARMRPSALELLGTTKHPRPIARMLQRAYRRVMSAQNSANSPKRRGGLV